MELGLILGLGIFSFLLCYFSFKLDPKHNLLRILTALFFVFSLVLIPKATLDYKDNCELVKITEYDHYTYGNNLTAGSPHWDGDELGGGQPQDLGSVYLLHINTTNTYDYVCDTNTNNTQTAFYKFTIGYIIVFSIYLLISLSYLALKYLMQSIYKGRK